MMRGASILAATIAIIASPCAAASSEFFSLSGDMTLESGDTWSIGAKRYRLYGVQSCIRGTSYTDRRGSKQDCGDASLAVLAAFMQDTRPSCAPIVPDADLTYAVCYATVAGQRLDLGTMLISEGFGFAALDPSGLPINPAYAVAEQHARARKAGLWQFPDVQHPSLLIGRASGADQRRSP
ncbi:thermonuclease family protein [Rhizobium sp. XQZ8]|nr:thermonuclease family protein [Rhizobium populisoli]MBW6425739.1 thermonuclease family protein [Rhizobium populisoli]